ncbi:hypothetical protein IMZ48_37155 [Candidatus Bathyarchaeota archaeon]|nr:hypothetical protein [Candidatus Bathyarchaeota archaeon]
MKKSTYSICALAALIPTSSALPPILTRATAEATAEVDRYPGNSDVGVYYTSTEPQGVGTVTGSTATVSMEGGLATAEPETTATTSSSGSSSTSSRASTTVGTTGSGGETEASEPGNSSGANHPCIMGAVLAGCVIVALL